MAKTKGLSRNNCWRGWETMGSHKLLVKQSDVSDLENTSRVGLPRWFSGKESSCNAGDIVQSMGQEDILEKKVESHSSVLFFFFF